MHFIFHSDKVQGLALFIKQISCFFFWSLIYRNAFLFFQRDKVQGFVFTKQISWGFFWSLVSRNAFIFSQRQGARVGVVY
jgi:hypothetical protein